MNATTTKMLTLERTFDATPIDLWAAWTDPKQYARWFNPAPGMDLVIHEFDVRPGGKIRFDMPQPDGNKNPQEGVFLTLTPFTRIETGAPDRSFLLDVRFEPVTPHRTRMVVHVTGVPPEYHQMATEGWGRGFDKLERVLAEPKKFRTLVLEHAFPRATPEQVYRAWTDAKVLAKWFSPIPGVDAHVRSLDARVGGRGHITVRPPEGEEFGFHLRYVHLEPGREVLLKVSPTADDAEMPTMSVRIRAEGKGAHLTFVSPDVPAAVASDAEGGWKAFFKKLDAALP